MNLEELRNEIKRLNSLKENREHCTIDTQLKAIKETVEALGDYALNSLGLNSKHYEYKMVEEIKELLNTSNTEKNPCKDCEGKIRGDCQTVDAETGEVINCKDIDSLNTEEKNGM